MENKEITICSVYHSSTAKRFLELNVALTERLNPKNNWQWILGDNTPARFQDKIDEKKFYKIIRGFDESDTDTAPAFGKYPAKKIGCFWHGGAINKLIKHVNTRFLLILDNNFYMVRQNWINDSIEHMKANNLAFFGAPNPPSNPKKYRYFPEVHCFFVDLNKIYLENLDFMPSYEFIPPVSRFKRSVRIVQKFLENSAPDSLSKIFDIILANRLRIGRSGDVGSRMSIKYNGNPDYKAECVQQIFNPSWIYKLSDLPFPDKFSFIPKRAGYYTTGNSFLPRGREKYGEHNWEVYKWKDIPFGFHIRGRGYGKFKTASEWEGLFGFIENLLEKYK